MRCTAFAVSVLVLAIGLTNSPAGAETLGFDQARDMAMTEHPTLKALAEHLKAARAEARQASALENPEIEVGSEDYGHSELEVVVTQPIPLGGARGAAVEVAEREAEIAELELEVGRLAIEAEVIRRFASVLAARDRLALVDSMIRLSTAGLEAIRMRVEAGASMEIDLVRARLAGEELRLERYDLERALVRGKNRLAGLWGESEFGFAGVSGSLDALVSLPDVGHLQSEMEGHPAWRLQGAERRLARAEIDEIRAQRWPELALSAGYLQSNEADEGAVLAGLSMSLPILDRKGAGIEAKNHRLAAVEYGADLERLERRATLGDLHSQLEGTRVRLTVLSGDLLPEAARIHTALERFYALGRMGILDVLEARGHLLEVRIRALDLVEEQALLAADLVELTGYRIDLIK